MELSAKNSIIAYMTHPKEETTLVIMKPDAIQRSLVGEIIRRFEIKGLKLIGIKMMKMDDVLLNEHYVHHKDKPFFVGFRKFMKSAPVVVLALSGFNAVKAVRLIAGPTYGAEADAGSIRGDLSMSRQSNVVHVSDSIETARIELERFFKPEELVEYTRADFEYLYGEEEKG